MVFYSIQDDDAYYRAFRRSGILSHYAYVRKSNYLLPQMIVEDAELDGDTLLFANHDQGATPESFPQFAARKKHYVYWIGIQEAPGLTAAYDGGGVSHGHS